MGESPIPARNFLIYFKKGIRNGELEPCKKVLNVVPSRIEVGWFPLGVLDFFPQTQSGGERAIPRFDSLSKQLLP